MLPVEGVSPETAEAMFLCILSFPSVHCMIFEDEEGADLSSMSALHAVSIAMHDKRQSVHVSFAVPHGPQPVFVDVHLRRIGDLEKKIMVYASLSGDGVLDWQSWRNSFASRLSGVSEWQQQNGLEHSPVTPTDGSIITHQRSVKLNAFGTGRDMRIWLGWSAHRPTLSLFEVQSENFILRIEKEALDLKDDRFESVSQSAGLSKSNQVPVRYETVDAINLEHASAVAHRILSTLGNQNGTEKCALSLHGDSLLVEVMSLAESGRRQIDFELKLAEAVAVHHREFECLENVVRALFEVERMSDYRERAMSMVENFCSLAGTRKKKSVLGSPGLRMEDEIMANSVLCLVKDLAGGASKTVGQSISHLFTTFENVVITENMNLAVKNFLRSILSATYKITGSELQALKRNWAASLVVLAPRKVQLLCYCFSSFRIRPQKFPLGMTLCSAVLHLRRWL